MTARLVPPPVIEEPVIRPSARVCTVARQLDEDPSQIRRMLKEGRLEGHKTGIRGVRVFLDSVERLQRERAIKAQKPAQDGPAADPPPRSRASQAAHRQAVTHLQALGLVPASRR